MSHGKVKRRHSGAPLEGCHRPVYWHIVGRGSAPPPSNFSPQSKAGVWVSCTPHPALPSLPRVIAAAKLLRPRMARHAHSCMQACERRGHSRPGAPFLHLCQCTPSRRCVDVLDCSTQQLGAQNRTLPAQARPAPAGSMHRPHTARTPLAVTATSQYAFHWSRRLYTTTQSVVTCF